jgi:RecB family exonuclease
VKDLKLWLQEHPAPARQARPKGMEISYSQIRAYLDCPWLYKTVYVDRRRAPMSPPSALGVSIHGALEAYHRGGGGDLARLLACCDENWCHAGFKDAQEQLEWHAKARRILERYHGDELERRSEVLAVEKDFLVPLEPHALRGTIDRIDRRPDGTVEVIDYKTHLDVESEEAAAENLQLGLYGLGARDCLDLVPAWLTLYYVATGKRTTVPFDPAREEGIVELVTRVADLAVTGRGFRADTTHCPSCDLRRTCPHSVSRD